MKRPAAFAVPGILYAVLAMLVVVPLVMIAAASVMSSAPFSGTPFHWTLENYRQLWSAEIGHAALDTLVVSPVVGSVVVVVTVDPPEVVVVELVDAFTAAAADCVGDPGAVRTGFPESGM